MMNKIDAIHKIEQTIASAYSWEQIRTIGSDHIDHKSLMREELVRQNDSVHGFHASPYAVNKYPDDASRKQVMELLTKAFNDGKVISFPSYFTPDGDDWWYAPQINIQLSENKVRMWEDSRHLES